MTTPKEREMGWRDAIVKVLEEADQPLHYAEIADRIKAAGLRTSLGATPEGTVSSYLGTMLKNKQRIGRSIIRKTHPGYWARAEVANNPVSVEESEDEDTALRAYGLQWNRNSVNWERTNGKLLGKQSAGISVDFADQDGIYLLHNGGEIVYAGKTFTRNSRTGLYGRLRSHHRDIRKTGRWDSFSWFGFKPVDPEGNLLVAPESIAVEQAIETIEAILIEGLLPRLNMRSGENIRKAQDTILFFQVEDEEQS